MDIIIYEIMQLYSIRKNRASKEIIGEDTWNGCKGNYKLIESLINSFHNQGIISLRETMSQNVRIEWSQGWLIIENLNLQANRVEEWIQYVKNRSHGVIILSDKKDKKKWPNNKGTRKYIAKLVYVAKREEE